MMNKSYYVVAVILLLAIQSILYGAGNKYMITKERTGIFKNKNELNKPVYTAEKDELVEVLNQKTDAFKLYLKVRIRTGITGWIKKSALTKPTSKKSKEFIMQEAKVVGYLENPQAVYILDTSDPDFKPIRIEYSVADFLFANIDKETFQRLYDEDVKPER